MPSYRDTVGLINKTKLNLHEHAKNMAYLQSQIGVYGKGCNLARMRAIYPRRQTDELGLEAGWFPKGALSHSQHTLALAENNK